MALFESFFQLGLNYMTSFKGYVWILVVLTLASGMRNRHLIRSILTVSSYVAGLLLAGIMAHYGWIRIKSNTAEVLLALSLFLASFTVLIESQTRYNRIFYFLALFLGLMGGFTLPFHLKARLLKESNDLVPMLAYYLGIETGLFVVVLIQLLLLVLAKGVFKVTEKSWQVFFAGAAMGIAALMLVGHLH